MRNINLEGLSGCKDYKPFKSTLDELSKEISFARNKFPGNTFLLPALMEEVGELAQAYLQKQSLNKIRREALQVACVALRIYEEGDNAFSQLDWKE